MATSALSLSLYPFTLRPTMASTSTARLPPPESPEEIRTRSKVIAAFWVGIIFLGLPIWWKTTSIYRARLPVREMVDWAEGKICRPVFPLEIQLQVPSMLESEAQHLVRTTQHALDDLNEFPLHHLRLKLAELPSPETALTVTLTPQKDLTTPRSQLRADTAQLDVFYPPSQTPTQSASNPLLSSFIADELQSLFVEEKATIAHILSSHSAGAGSGGISAGRAQPASSQSAADSVSPRIAEDITRRLRRSMKYAETYHLSFSLFTPGSTPSSWDIEEAVREYVAPLLQAFDSISTFSVDSQVQIYATFAPTAPLPEYDESQAAWLLKRDDLSAFINAAEWPLSPSIGAGPTINFILYVPSASQSPLVVRDDNGAAATSWIIPQWGGVVLLNPDCNNQSLSSSSSSSSNPTHLSREMLRPAFLTFSHQLLTLLGTPSTPASLPFRLGTLVRMHTAMLILSASSTMGSLAHLTESLPSIPIPRSVAASVATTLSSLAAACDLLRRGSFAAALAAARVAHSEAERSFFEKSMVGQVYFPEEHKVAVYLPLLGPVGVPLLLALVKELKRRLAAWRAASKS